MRSAKIAPASSSFAPLQSAPQDFGRPQMPLGASRRGKAEDRRRIDDHGKPVRHQRVINGVPLGHIAFYHAGHWIGHAVRQVDAGVAKANASEGRGQES